MRVVNIDWEFDEDILEGELGFLQANQIHVSMLHFALCSIVGASLLLGRELSLLECSHKVLGQLERA